MLRYLATAAVTISEADVRHALVEVLPTLEERIMPTMVETWLEQGIQVGEKRMLLRLLERRFGKAPKTYQTRIADADTLLLWSERVLFAQRLADVLSELPPSKPAG